MSLKRLIVTGGYQRQGAIWMKEFQHYRRGVLAEVDVNSGDVRVLLEYESPPEVCAPERPSLVFKCATLRGDRLYLCTQTEVLVLEWPSLRQLRYVSLPTFNDVHHVLPDGDELLVVSTGLDMVIRVDASGRETGHHYALEGDPWQRFSRSVDYRRVASTKPHLAHPNFIFEARGQLWVSRCERRDAVLMTDPSMRIPIDIERLHDGNVEGDEAVFTTVNGYVAAADLETRTVSRSWALPKMTDTERPLGWCRGLHLEGDLAYVGFSRIRPTKLHDNLRWVKNLGKERGYLPTRIGVYDLARRAHVKDLDLEGAGLAAVFSVLPVYE